MPPIKILLTQNSELKKVGVWNWSIPAHTVKLDDGSWFNCCPNAGACGRVCYAKMGTYIFSNVKRAHMNNLMMILEKPAEWESLMKEELQHKRMQPTGTPFDLDHDPSDEWLHWWITNGGKAVRIHDAGDFFSREYLASWERIAEATPDVLFYAYTKEVVMLKNATLPNNFRIIFSYGGKQDDMIDPLTDRHADVFPTLSALEEAGYYNQEENDLLAISAPSNKIGIVANNLPVANKRFAGKTMSGLSTRDSG